jgi:hypothetical protein
MEGLEVVGLFWIWDWIFLTAWLIFVSIYFYFSFKNTSFSNNCFSLVLTVYWKLLIMFWIKCNWLSTFIFVSSKDFAFSSSIARIAFSISFAFYFYCSFSLSFYLY